MMRDGKSERRIVDLWRREAIPSFSYDGVTLSRGGLLLEESKLEGAVLPLTHFWVLAAYWFPVVRWNPESRWARRILEGKRRR